MDRAAMLLAATALLATAACGPEPRPLFEECAAECGLDVVLTCGAAPDRKDTILEVNGNGVALSDLDGDGDLDVVLVDGSTRDGFLQGRLVEHHVFVNQGVRDGKPRFERVEDTGLVMSGWPTGITAGDIDQDGRPDLVIGGIGEDVLFLNRTEGGRIHFEQRPLPGRGDALDWTSSLALADANGDGLLDLYLVRYLFIDPADPPLGAVGDVPCRFGGMDVMCGPHGLPPQPDVLLAGLDTAGGFEDVTVAAGLAEPEPSYGLGVLFADLDGDGWPDLYVANDSVDNFVLRNRGDGRFEDVGALSGAATDRAGRAQAGMGVALGDVDANGTFDIAVTNFSDETNALYTRIDGMQYRDAVAAAGLAQTSRPMLGWGVHLADFDGDGLLDLFVSNGHVFPEADEPGSGSRYAQPLQWFPGRLDEGRFVLEDDAFPDPRPWRGRAAARGDLDGDGDLDLVVLTLNGPPLLYLNRSDDPDRYMLVTLRDGPRDAFGASLSLELDGTLHSRQKLSSEGFQTSNDPRLHFGRPAGAGPPDAAVVLWPGGERERLEGHTLPWGHHVVVEKGRGVVATSPLESGP